MLILKKFDFEIRYISGKKADVLTRCDGYEKNDGKYQKSVNLEEKHGRSKENKHGELKKHFKIKT